MLRTTLRVLLCAVVAGLVLASTASAVVRESGYITARDGTELRYSVERPDGEGPFPVALNYEGYAAGTNPRDNGVGTYANRLLQRGYAIVGVSVRGTGCSEGVFDPFAKTMGTDGYDAIEWAARQPWSDGRVGMIGVSFGGITQLLTAAEQPPHLKAIAPSSALSDLYRDVAYPGGILEYDFVFAWTAIQKQGGAQYALTQAPQNGDQKCIENFATHEAGNAHPDFFIPSVVSRNPYYDDYNGEWIKRAPASGFRNITVPAYLLNSWQDEQLPARIFGDLDKFPHPERLWVDVTNGNHGRDYEAAYAQERTLLFLDRFVREVDNGFEAQVPHLNIAMETHIRRDGRANNPAWHIERDSVVPERAEKRLYLAPGGALEPPVVREPKLPNPRAKGPKKDKPPKEQVPPAGSDSYAYPLPSGDVTEPGVAQEVGPLGLRTMGQFTWKAPTVPGGHAAYTTAPLTEDLVVAGPASLDLWLRSTAPDTDIQATITEVRPDGQETYVQRGWLRASHRKLDEAKSTALRPVHTHLRGDAKSLAPLEATPMRVEIFPFAHAFRRGSRLRLWIDAPTGHTGFWAFAFNPTPALNTVLYGKGNPSRLVLGQLEGETARAPLPACDALRNQPCREDPLK